jgi:hypothetical protein
MNNTPRETPISKALELGLESCPCCKRQGSLTGGVQCSFCFGGRVVTKAKADAWRLAHTLADDVPDTEPGT